MKRLHMANDDVIAIQFVGERVMDYEWPLRSGDRWVIQEQFVKFLDIMGFKRKYPKIFRRRLETEEVKYLYELKYLSEQQYSMGVVAISVLDAQDVLRKDFPSRHDEFLRQKMKRQRQSMKLNIPAEEMPAQLKKAAKSVSEFTSRLNLIRKESFSSFYDSNSNTLHLPRNRFKMLKKWQTKKSPYPVAVLAGQYKTDYKTYTPQELKMMPLNTVLSAPPLEANEYALNVFDENELHIDPDEELVSDDEEEIARKAEERRKVEEEKERKRKLKEEAENDKLEKESNSSAVSEDTCCTCRKPYEGDYKIAKCSICIRSSHIECLAITEEQHAVIQTYKWACIECKTCTVCAQARNEEQILFCDRCDRGYHTFCVALRSIPKGKIWTCRVCFKEDPSYSEKHGGKKMRARRRKTKNLKEFLDE